MTARLRNSPTRSGAEVCDVDVAKPRASRASAEIYKAFLDHGILLFATGDITREQHIEFSRRFGELDRHDSLPRDRHPKMPRNCSW
jgi:taurine dioxygenase